MPSSSFSTALLLGLNYLKNEKQLDPHSLAESASHLEIELLNEPIGKQDQYATAFGGFNFFQFNPDGSVLVEPLNSDIFFELEKHLLLFFMGTTRDASSILNDQRSKIKENFETYKKMSDSVLIFKTILQRGNIQALGEMLEQGWIHKKSLSKNISNTHIDSLYEAGKNAGAWGGKVPGAGGSGCILFIAPPKAHEAIREALFKKAEDFSLTGFREIPFRFFPCGTEICFVDNANHSNFFPKKQ